MAGGRLARAVWSRLKEHKKKTAFFAVASIAFVNIGRSRVEERRIFLDYCLKARSYGREPIAPLENPRKVTVLVGDELQNQKTWRSFEKYALPLLHLAGVKVDIAQLSSLYDNSADREWKTSDALYVVGRDSEISQIINLLMGAGDMDVRELRRAAKQVPALAFFPAECHEHVAEQLLPRSYPLVRWYCESAMAVIAGVHRSGAVVKYKIDDKPAVLTIGCVHIGDIGETSDLRFAVFRKMRERWLYLRKALMRRSSESIHLSVEYAEPCYGCKRCSYADPKSSTRGSWLSWLFNWRNNDIGSGKLESSVVNDRCGERTKLTLSTCEVSAFNNLRSDVPKLSVAFGPEYMNKWEYLVETWRRVRSERPYITSESTSVQKALEASECVMELHPKNSHGENQQCTVVVDGEQVEASTITLQTVPNIFRLLAPCPKVDNELGIEDVKL
uniref:Uncharacterized protein n=1 Tax=Trichuris muris TaxID=70415 RepID=A0A5S6QPF3_TRIMR